MPMSMSCPVVDESNWNVSDGLLLIIIAQCGAIDFQLNLLSQKSVGKRIRQRKCFFLFQLCKGKSRQLDIKLFYFIRSNFQLFRYHILLRIFKEFHPPEKLQTFF